MEQRFIEQAGEQCYSLSSHLCDVCAVSGLSLVTGFLVAEVGLTSLGTYRDMFQHNIEIALFSLSNFRSDHLASQGQVGVNKKVSYRKSSIKTNS